MKKLILLVSLLLVASNVWSAGEYLPYDESANAEIELANAITEASKENKYVLIEMGANWCPDCRTLGRYFQREDIKAWLDERFIVVAVDVGEWIRIWRLLKDMETRSVKAFHRWLSWTQRV